MSPYSGQHRWCDSSAPVWGATGFSTPPKVQEKLAFVLVCGNPCCAPGDAWLSLSFLLRGCCARAELARGLEAGLGGISHRGGNWEAGR